ncbi:hypothetical protein GCM10027044_40460 [Hymenobacter ruber]
MRLGKIGGGFHQVAGLLEGAHEGGAQGGFVFNEENFHEQEVRMDGGTAAKEGAKFVYILCRGAYEGLQPRKGPIFFRIGPQFCGAYCSYP